MRNIDVILRTIIEYEKVAPSKLPTNAPPINAIGVPCFDRLLVGVFNRVVLTEDNDQRLQILGAAADRYASWVEKPNCPAATADGLRQVRIAIADWYLALTT